MVKTQFENRLDNFPFTETEERNHTEIKDSFNKSVSVSLNIYNGTMAHRYVREKRPLAIFEWIIVISCSVAIWKLASSCIDLGALSAFSMYLK